MQQHRLGQHLDIAFDDVLAFLDTDPAAIMLSPAAQKIADPTNLSILRASLPEAQQLMKASLPEFYAWLAQELGITNIPDSPDHAIEWMIDFLIGRMEIGELVEYHGLLPARIIEQAAPRFIAIFADLQFGRKQWEQVTDLLSIALLAAARKRERSAAHETREETT
jgi:hypothetical protein